MLVPKPIFLVLLLGCFGHVTVARAAECVVLLHGLARTASSMEKMADTLADQGYHTVNVDYPSREKPIEDLADLAINQGLQACRENHAARVNFVTHSLGGILVRQYYRQHDPAEVKRVVMLGPPNQGSEVVDHLKDAPGFEWLNGPAGLALGTGDDGFTRQLGPVNFPLGVIAGTRSINLILSTYLPDPDDGKVSVASARVEGMCELITLPVTHPFMMQNDEVIEETIHFLAHGRFRSASLEEGVIAEEWGRGKSCDETTKLLDSDP